MTDHKEIIELLEKMENDAYVPCYVNTSRCGNCGGCTWCRLKQIFTLLRTAQEPAEIPNICPAETIAEYPESMPPEPIEQPNCEGCEFFKHNNKYEHCWRYTQLTSVCKLHHKDQPLASELTDWLRKTISGARYEKGDKELRAKVREACGRLDKADAKYENKCDNCVYLEADGEIINEHINKHIAYDKQIKQLEAKLKAKDELLFAYESVNAPVNPLLAASREMIKISRQVSSMAGKDWLQGQLLLIDKTDDFEAAIAKQS